MKHILLLICLVGVAIGCGPPNAPTMKRVVSCELFDEHYLKEVFVPSYRGESSRLELSNAVSQLNADLAEFRAVMQLVEVGKIPVVRGFKGHWQSSVTNDGARISAVYAGYEGHVVDFQKHSGQYPYLLMYEFSISSNGYLSWVSTPEDGFQFDEHGRVGNYWHK